jgi:tetratricopeptide (TPR) repeat protein
VPRWLSEGLSVLEERRARPGWGAHATVEFLAAYKADRLRPVSTLNDGFVRPRYPAEVQYSYYLASLVSEMIEQDFGAAKLPALMQAYSQGLESPEVFQRVLGVTGDSLDARFKAYMNTRFGPALANIEPGEGPGMVGGPFVDAMQEGLAHAEANRTREATAAFEKAQAMLPDVNTPGGPAWHLARLALARGDTATSLAQLARVTRTSETALQANTLEADILAARGDDAGVVAAIDRIIWMAPYDAALHARLADAATRAGKHNIAVRERRAILAIGAPDPLEARYQLAQSLFRAGDVPAARREVLSMLESAPGFEKAQSLLLQLRAGTPPGAP